MARKTIIAVLFVSIALPYIINSFINYNIFGTKGLAEKMLIVAIGNVPSSVFLKLVRFWNIAKILFYKKF